uniref:Protein maelstrom homolog n=1 Tax=Ornithorhynchus anatinus TaxID=9258 RepID=A0A6I8NJF3_ORNAN
MTLDLPQRLEQCLVHGRRLINRLIVRMKRECRHEAEAPQDGVRAGPGLGARVPAPCGPPLGARRLAERRRPARGRAGIPPLLGDGQAAGHVRRGRRGPRRPVAVAVAMPNRRPTRNAYYFFVLEKMPELRRQGLAVSRVVDAIPLCSADWGLLTEEEREKYVEMAREWKANLGKSPEKQKCATASSEIPGPAYLPTSAQQNLLPDMDSLSLKTDEDVLERTFYFLNIFSHGELPPHCTERFLPCEIGCIKYSLQEGIMEQFHSFIDPGEVPRGFRFHCQAASDTTHKIPISNFHLSGGDFRTVIRNFYQFIHPNQGDWPLIYCKSDDWFRVNWCLKRMGEEAESTPPLELLLVEDLVLMIYQKKLQKEASKTWVQNLLEVSLWDYSSNTRYCISNSLATLFGITLTQAHVPLQDYEPSGHLNPKTVVVDAGRFQKQRAKSPGFHNSAQEQAGSTSTAFPGDAPSTKPKTKLGRGRGRGITRLMESRPGFSLSSFSKPSGDQASSLSREADRGKQPPTPPSAARKTEQTGLGTPGLPAATGETV